MGGERRGERGEGNKRGRVKYKWGMETRVCELRKECGWERKGEWSKEEEGRGEGKGRDGRGTRRREGGQGEGRGRNFEKKRSQGIGTGR